MFNLNQKTGNAIRALGRMATLSANSRRNSSTSTVSSSSRSSMINGSVSSESQKPSMQPLNEEDVTSEPIPLPPPAPPKIMPIDQTDYMNSDHKKSTELTNGDRLMKEKTCTERSDSGFSDCSSCSNGHANLAPHVLPNAAIAHPLFDKVNSISEEKLLNDQNQRDNNANDVKEFDGKLSVNMLKMKLEKMAEAQQDIKSFSPDKKSVKKLSTPFVVENNNTSDDAYVEHPFEGQQMRTSYSFEFAEADFLRESEHQPKSLQIKSSPKTLIRSSSLHQKRIIDKEPIMKSDFTNTVKMRKKSLESSAVREKQIHSSRILLEPSGKVSKLLRRFDSQNSTSNGSQSDGITSEPIVETPGVDDSSKEMVSKHVDISKANDETFSTPLAVTHKSPTSARKSPAKMSKSIVSSGSMKRTFATKHEYTNTKTCVTSMEVKVTAERQSPTKFANTVSNAPYNRATQNKAIHNQSKHSNALKQKSHDSTTVDGNGTASTQRASRNAKTTNKTTAYSSFNRTSPVRLSGRVKEVTERLSAPKAIIKAPSSNKDRLDTKMSHKNSMPHNHHHHHHPHLMGMKSIVTVAESVIETQHHVEHTINGKIDGTFTLKSKMNENFRKASAFWKAT